MCYFNKEQEMLEEGERFNKFKKGAKNAVLGAALGASLGAGGMRYHMNKNVIPVKEKQAIERTKEDYNKNVIPVKEKQAANKAVEEFEVMLDKGMKNGKSLYDIKNQRKFENLIKDTLSDFDSLKKEFGPNAYKVYNFIKSEKAAYDNGERTCEDALKNMIDFLDNLENKEHSPQKTKPNYVSDGIGGVMAKQKEKTKPNYVSDGIGGVMAKQKEKTKQFANDIASNYGREHLKEEVNYFPY